MRSLCANHIHYCWVFFVGDVAEHNIACSQWLILFMLPCSGRHSLLWLWPLNNLSDIICGVHRNVCPVLVLVSHSTVKVEISVTSMLIGCCVIITGSKKPSTNLRVIVPAKIYVQVRQSTQWWNDPFRTFHWLGMLMGMIFPCCQLGALTPSWRADCILLVLDQDPFEAALCSIPLCMLLFYLFVQMFLLKHFLNNAFCPYMKIDWRIHSRT